MRERFPYSAVGAAVVISAFLLPGCDKPESKSSTPTPASAAKPADTAKPADAAGGTAEAAGAVDADAKTAAAEVPAAADKAVPAAADDAAAAADAAAGDTTAKATELLNQVTTYVKENKLDLAEKALVQLEKLKPQLPAAYQSKVDTARTMFDTAKKGQGLKDIGSGLLGK